MSDKGQLSNFVSIEKVDAEKTEKVFHKDGLIFQMQKLQVELIKFIIKLKSQRIYFFGQWNPKLKLITLFNM